jgi:hypothetical protein
MALGQKTGGRKKNSKNRVTRSVKEGYLNTFIELQQSDRHNLTAWAKKNLTVFYSLATKLIPTEIGGHITQVNTTAQLTDDELNQKINAIISKQSE